MCELGMLSSLTVNAGATAGTNGNDVGQLYQLMFCLYLNNRQMYWFTKNSIRNCHITVPIQGRQLTVTQQVIK